ISSPLISAWMCRPSAPQPPGCGRRSAWARKTSSRAPSMESAAAGVTSSSGGGGPSVVTSPPPRPAVSSSTTAPRIIALPTNPKIRSVVDDPSDDCTLGPPPPTCAPPAPDVCAGGRPTSLRPVPCEELTTTHLETIHEEIGGPLHQHRVQYREAARDEQEPQYQKQDTADPVDPGQPATHSAHVADEPTEEQRRRHEGDRQTRGVDEQQADPLADGL